MQLAKQNIFFGAFFFIFFSLFTIFFLLNFSLYPIIIISLAPPLAATFLISPHRRPRSQLGPLVLVGRLSLHSRFDLSTHSHEGLLHIGCILGGCFYEFNAKTVGKLFPLFKSDCSLGCQIALVSYQQLVDILRGVSINLMQPLFHIVKRFSVCHVVYHDDTVGTSVVRGSDGAEPLLTSSVPDLKLNCLPI